jgi:hypothetical protein
MTTMYRMYSYTAIPYLCCQGEVEDEDGGYAGDDDGQGAGEPLHHHHVYITTKPANSAADPDRHSICPLDKDPASECGFGSSYLNISAKSQSLL